MAKHRTSKQILSGLIKSGDDITLAFCVAALHDYCNQAINLPEEQQQLFKNSLISYQWYRENAERLKAQLNDLEFEK